MSTGQPNTSQSQSACLAEYLEQNPVSMDVLETIHADIRKRNILNALLICVNDKKVIPLSNSFLISRSMDLVNNADISDYTEWRKDHLFVGETVDTLVDKIRAFESEHPELEEVTHA